MVAMTQERAEIIRSQEWWADGSDYDTYVRRELGDGRFAAWRNVLSAHLPRNQRLRILDVGTGPGFFACVLASLGHEVTGIDMSADMLAHARENARPYGDACHFAAMNAQELDFADATFDLVVSRNVTWTLPNPERAYREWMRVLKPGGMVLVYDANWHLEFYDADVARAVRANERRYRDRFGEEFRVCTDDRDYYDSLPLSSIVRPAWDERALRRAGFIDVTVDGDVGARVYADWERDLYSATPLFEVRATKPFDGGSRAHLRSYWDERSDTFGLDGEKTDAWGELIQRQLPSGRPLRILDVGCGTGALSLAMARRGHQVTGVDFSDGMLEMAARNAREAGVHVELRRGDAAGLPWDGEEFDVVMHRNVMWNMTDPERAIAQWRDVLVPGGQLVYFDSSWYGYLYDGAADAQRVAHYGTGSSPIYDVLERAAARLPLSRECRPEWDCAALRRACFEDVRAQDVSSLVWTPEEQVRYTFAPQFMVCARKARA